MRTREFEQILKDLGFLYTRQTGSHRMWTNGLHNLSVPCGVVNRMLARKLLKKINYTGQVTEIKYNCK